MCDSTKKVAVIGTPFEICKGGAELQCSLLRDALNQSYKFSFVFPKLLSPNNSIQPDIENLITFKNSYIGMKSYNQYSRFFNLDIIKAYKTLHKLSPDIIYSQSFDYVLLAAVLYGKRHNVPTIWHIASEKNTWPAKKQKRHKLDLFSSTLMSSVVKNVSCIIGQANYEKTLLYKNWKRDCDFIVPNWHPSPEKKINKTLPQTVIWIGNLKGMKQPELFIQLAKDMSRRKDARFVMIGRKASGCWQDKLMTLISKCPNLEYLGEKSIEQVNEILNDSHILVCTSLYEGFPNTYIQSWLREVPVASLTVDPDNILVRNGIGFCSGSYNQLRNDVQKLLESPSLREKMGKKAREYALKNHDMTRNASIMKGIFDNFCSN